MDWLKTFTQNFVRSSFRTARHSNIIYCLLLCISLGFYIPTFTTASYSTSWIFYRHAYELYISKAAILRHPNIQCISLNILPLKCTSPATNQHFITTVKYLLLQITDQNISFATFTFYSFIELMSKDQRNKDLIKE